jgi:hypothetical protein
MGLPTVTQRVGMESTRTHCSRSPPMYNRPVN